MPLRLSHHQNSHRASTGFINPREESLSAGAKDPEPKPLESGNFCEPGVGVGVFEKKKRRKLSRISKRETSPVYLTLLYRMVLFWSQNV